VHTPFAVEYDSDKRAALDLLRPGPADEDVEGNDSAPGPGRRGSRIVAVAGALLQPVIAAETVECYLRPGTVFVRAVAVTTAPAAKGIAPRPILSASGHVVPRLRTTVGAHVTGMITAVYVQPGDHVRTGEVRARLDDSAALATVAAAKAQVAADQALIPPYEAQAANDSRNLRRYGHLAKTSLVSAETLDAARTVAATSAAALAHGADVVNADRKVLGLDKMLLTNMVIRAPVIGVVTDIYAHPSQIISPQAVGEFTETGKSGLVDMNSLEVDVDEAYISRLKSTDPAHIVLDAYPGSRISGHMINVAPTADRQTSTVKVQTAFDRLDSRILPQTAAQVQLKAPLIASTTTALRHDIRIAEQ